MHWDDLEQYNTDEVIEDISDGELFELESATRIAYRDYSKHIAAVEAYEQALAQRRRYEEYCVAKKVATAIIIVPGKSGQILTPIIRTHSLWPYKSMIMKAMMQTVLTLRDMTAKVIIVPVLTAIQVMTVVAMIFTEIPEVAT